MTKSNIIKTSHELNHFRGGYTRLELDFIYAFITQIRDEDDELQAYDLTLSQLEAKLGRSLRLRDVEYMFDSLIKKSFKVNNTKELTVYSFFTTISFNKEEKRLRVKFNPDLKPHLIQLQTYAMGNFKYILQFNSEYSKRLYMLACQWVNATKIVYSVDELREMLAVPGSYQYAQFKQKILKPAEKELVEKEADIYFEFEEIKEGRKVAKILFRVKRRPKEKYEAPKGNFDAAEFVGQLIYFSGRNWTINAVAPVDGGEIHVILEGESGTLQAEQMPITKIRKMIEHQKQQPTLL
jgi:plasmid replication initiation protein